MKCNIFGVHRSTRQCALWPNLYFWCFWSDLDNSFPLSPFPSLTPFPSLSPPLPFPFRLDLVIIVISSIINAITCRKVSFKAGQKFQTKFRKSIMIASLNVKLSMNSKKYILMALNGFLFLLKEISNAENRRRGNERVRLLSGEKNMAFTILCLWWGQMGGNCQTWDPPSS